MDEKTEELEFRFQYVDAAGNATGFRSKLGCVMPTGVDLKGVEIPHEAIFDTAARDSRLILVLDGAQVPEEILKRIVDHQVLALQVSKAKPVDLKRRIDRITSIHRAKRNRDALVAEGKEDTFRCLACPECEATLDVSGLPDTRYVYCPYCESLAGHDGERVPSGQHYRLCEECSWFDRVQGYTEFYFYFLLVLYGFSYKRRHLCDTCVNRVFWKVLLLNLVFILGVPSAIWMKVKSKFGRVEGFESLARANALAKKGRAAEALQLYNSALERYPGHPGVLFSQASGELAAENLPGARDFLARALQECSNYIPAQGMLQSLDEWEAQVAQQPGDIPAST